MRRGTPIASICSIAFGRAASDEVVENAIRAGSFTALRNGRRGTRASLATGSSTTSPKTTSAPYSVSTSRPRLPSTLRPPCPTVTAIAAPIPIGANFITMAVNLNIVSASPSQNPSIASLGRPRTCERATAKITEKNTTCSTWFWTAASKKLCGTMCSSTLANVGCPPPATGAPAAGGGSFTPTPGLTMFTASRPMNRASVVTTSK